MGHRLEVAVDARQYPGIGQAGRLVPQFGPRCTHIDDVSGRLAGRQLADRQVLRWERTLHAAQQLDHDAQQALDGRLAKA